MDRSCAWGKEANWYYQINYACCMLCVYSKKYPLQYYIYIALENICKYQSWTAREFISRCWSAVVIRMYVYCIQSILYLCYIMLQLSIYSMKFLFALNGTYIIFRFPVFIYIFAMFCLWLYSSSSSSNNMKRNVCMFSNCSISIYGVFRIFYSSWIAVAVVGCYFIWNLLVNDVQM